MPVLWLWPSRRTTPYGERPPLHKRRSIVVPTHARPEFIEGCVGSIVAAMGDDDELIVMECCNPGAAAALRGLGPNVHHVSGPHAGKSRKVNDALRIAEGDVVLLTDDDCRVPQDWVDSLDAAFENLAVGVAFGPSEGLTSTGPTSPLLPPGLAPPELWNYAHGLSMAVRREAAFDVGGFDERFGPGAAIAGGEEGDLVLRLADRGWLAAIAGGAPVHHLAWRDESEARRNARVYQHGAGAQLGAAFRRGSRAAVKPALLRLVHERGYWRRGASAPLPRFRMAGDLLSGLSAGFLLSPRRSLEATPARRSHSPRPRVVWVTAEAPDRNQGGGNIRQAMLLHELREQADVTLLLVGHLEDARTRSDVDAVLTVARPRLKLTDGRIRRRCRDLWRVLAQRQPAEITGSSRARRGLQPVLMRIADNYDVVV
ncbi:MAG: glycosyltransferase, partial [Acidimicrobiia bacterium]|nr:glycosyltransferase [Acidimicrobiia bacterium]